MHTGWAMKNKSSSRGSRDLTSDSFEALHATLNFLMESPLEVPEVERQAKLALRAVKRMGYRFQDPLDDCLVCLYMALMSAHQEMQRVGR